jgi:hypothetical protein
LAASMKLSVICMFNFWKVCSPLEACKYCHMFEWL